jgi:pimeloyl-ACP methyl ester carboxylesterase
MVEGAAGRERKVAMREEIRIAYTATGTGAPIVLIPSLGRGAEDFDAIVPTIAEAGFRVLTPEPRGIDGSTPMASGETLRDLAADIAAMIVQDGGEPVIVAGHAAGNWVARVLAHDRPDLVRGVVLMAAIVSAEADPAMRRSISASFDMALPEAERLVHLRHAYFAASSDARVWLSGWHPEVAKAQRAASAATGDRDWLRAADRFPLLYIGAAEDRISRPPALEELRSAIGANADLVIIEQAGHALLPEQPIATAEALIDWARGLP